MRLIWILFWVSTLASASDRRPVLQQAPPKTAAQQNPYQGNERAARAGQKIFAKECGACHGSFAQGGRRAPALASPAIRKATPGEIFWVLRNGSLKHGMPSYSHLPEQQRWQVITYLKTL